MVVQLGQMQLPAPQDPDPSDDYFNGTISGGGLWTALTRASDHDHTGGVNGKPISVAGIPDGSITTAKLDPSVLLPYALVDGSKPFTGQVTMQADAIVRDALYFGQQGTALAPDATLTRTGAGALRVDTHLGVGVNPSAAGTVSRFLEVRAVGGGSSTRVGQFYPAALAYLTANAVFDGTNWNLDATASDGVMLALQGDPGSPTLTVDRYPAGANPATARKKTQLQIAPTGTLTLTPDAGQPVLHMNKPDAASYLGYASLQRQGTARWVVGLGPGDEFMLYNGNLTKIPLQVAPTGTLTLTPDAGSPSLASAGWMFVQTGGGSGFAPQTDNAAYLGFTANRWYAVYAGIGTINTSSATVKEGITPLSPAACYQAAKDVRWYEYAYLPPAYTTPEPPPDIAYDAADDNETKAEKKAARDEAEAQAKAAHLKMVAETAPSRHQRGFVFPAGAESKDEAGGALPPVPDLFGLSDRESTTPQADLATLGAAMQELIRRFEIVEAKVS